VPGQLTKVSLAALNLSLSYEQMCWPLSVERFMELRRDTYAFFEIIGVEGVELPVSRDAYLEDRPKITPVVLGILAENRSKLLGDIYALPLFFLGSMSYRAAINMALQLGYEQEEQIIGDCLEDLGVDQRVTKQLEREAGWIAVRDEETDEQSVAQADVIRAGAVFHLPGHRGDPFRGR
jgi:hypothetical protein